MKRVALILTVVAVLFVGAGAALAHDHHGYGYHHGGIPGPVVVRRPVVVVPTPVVVRPRIVYPSVYRYRYCEPTPSFGFQYNGPNVSVGVWF
jgi:hypothetical protein